MDLTEVELAAKAVGDSVGDLAQLLTVFWQRISEADNDN